MQAILDKIVVKETQEKSEDSVIVRPDSAQSPIVYGEIIALGQEVFTEDEKECILPGATVVFPRSKAYGFSFNGEKLLVIREDDVLAVL